MEFCVARPTGQIVSAKADGAAWGSGESYSRYVAAGLEPGRWADRKIFVIRVPELGELDGYRYASGIVDLDWLTSIEGPEPEIALVEWTSVATIGAETDPV